jgi:ABC-type antimicrobial peptide transport system permease subunit
MEEQRNIMFLNKNIKMNFHSKVNFDLIYLNFYKYSSRFKLKNICLFSWAILILILLSKNICIINNFLLYISENLKEIL